MKNKTRGEIVTFIVLIVFLFIGITTIISTQFLKSSKNKIATNSRAAPYCPPEEYPCEPAGGGGEPPVVPPDERPPSGEDPNNPINQPNNPPSSGPDCDADPASCGYPGSQSPSGGGGGDCSCINGIYQGPGCGGGQAGESCGLSPGNEPTSGQNSSSCPEGWASDYPGGPCDQKVSTSLSGSGSGSGSSSGSGPSNPTEQKYYDCVAGCGSNLSCLPACGGNPDKPTNYDPSTGLVNQNINKDGSAKGPPMFTDIDGKLKPVYLLSPAARRAVEDQYGKIPGAGDSSWNCGMSGGSCDKCGWGGWYDSGCVDRHYIPDPNKSPNDPTNWVRIGSSGAPDATAAWQVNAIKSCESGSNIDVSTGGCRVVPPKLEEQYYTNKGIYSQQTCSSIMNGDYGGNGDCIQVGVDSKGKPLYQYLNTNQLDSYYKKNGYTSKQSCITTMNGDYGGNGDCKSVGHVDSNGNTLYQYLNSSQLEKYNAQNGLMNQYGCSRTVEDNNGGGCVFSGKGDSKGNPLYQYLTQQEVNEAKQRQQEILQKQQQVLQQQQEARLTEIKQTAEECERDCSGTCMKTASGITNCVGLTQEQKIAYEGNTLPNNEKCGGKFQKSCMTNQIESLSDINGITYAQTCSTGLRPYAGICSPDKDYAKSQAALSSFMEDKNGQLVPRKGLTTDEVATTIGLNIKNTKYLPELSRTLCGAPSSKDENQCVYSNDEKSFVWAKSTDAINQYAALSGYNFDTNKGKSGEYGGQCEGTVSVFRMNFGGNCHGASLACNSGGTCDLTETAIKHITEERLNSTGTAEDLLASQRVNNYFGSTSSLASDGNFAKNFLKDINGLNLAPIGGSCVQGLGGDVIRPAGNSCTDPEIAKLYTLPNETGESFCAEGGTQCGREGNASVHGCPTGFVYCEEGVPNTGQEGYIKVNGVNELKEITTFHGRGGECDNQTVGCYKGLGCGSDGFCGSVTKLAYSEDWAKGDAAVRWEKAPIPIINSLISSINISLNPDRSTAARVQAKMFEDQKNKGIETFGYDKFVKELYPEMYANLSSSAKGQYLNLALQEDSANHPDDWGNKGANWLREQGSKFGEFAGAYGGGAFFNPYMDAGEVIHDNKPITNWEDVRDKGGAWLKAGFYTAMPIVDIVSVVVPVAKGVTTIGEVGLRTVAEQAAKEALTKSVAKAGAREIVTKGVFTGIEKTGSIVTHVLEPVEKVVNSKKFIVGLTGAGGYQAAQEDPAHAPLALLPLAFNFVPGAVGKVVGKTHEIVAPLINKIPGISGHFDEQIARDAVKSVIEQGYRESKQLAATDIKQAALDLAKKKGLINDKIIENTSMQDAMSNALKSTENKKLVPADYSKLLDNDIHNVMTNPTEYTTIPSIARQNAARDVVELGQRLGITDESQVQALGKYIQEGKKAINPVIKDKAIADLQQAFETKGIETTPAKRAAQNVIETGVLNKSVKILDITASDVIKSVKESSALTPAEKTQVEAAISNGNLSEVGTILTGSPGLAKNIETAYIQKVLKDPLVKTDTFKPIVDSTTAVYQDVEKHLHSSGGKTVFKTEQEAILEALKEPSGKFYTPDKLSAGQIHDAQALVKQLEKDGKITIASNNSLPVKAFTGIKDMVASAVNGIKSYLEAKSNPPPKALISENETINKALTGDSVELFHRNKNPGDLESIKNSGFKASPGQSVNLDGKTYEPIHFSAVPPEAGKFDARLDTSTSVKGLKIFDGRTIDPNAVQPPLVSLMRQGYDGALFKTPSALANSNIEIIIFDGEKVGSKLKPLEERRIMAPVAAPVNLVSGERTTITLPDGTIVKDLTYPFKTGALTDISVMSDLQMSILSEMADLGTQGLKNSSRYIELDSALKVVDSELNKQWGGFVNSGAKKAVTSNQSVPQKPATAPVGQQIVNQTGAGINLPNNQKNTFSGVDKFLGKPTNIEGDVFNIVRKDASILNLLAQDEAAVKLKIRDQLASKGYALNDTQFKIDEAADRVYAKLPNTAALPGSVRARSSAPVILPHSRVSSPIITQWDILQDRLRIKPLDRVKLTQMENRAIQNLNRSGRGITDHEIRQTLIAANYPEYKIDQSTINRVRIAGNIPNAIAPVPAPVRPPISSGKGTQVISPVSLKDQISKLNAAQDALNKRNINDPQLLEVWQSSVRDSDGTWSKYGGENYFSGTQAAPDFTKQKEIIYLKGTIETKKAFIEGLHQGRMDGSIKDFEKWLKELHVSQSEYQGHAYQGVIRTGDAPYAGAHMNIVKQDVIPLAKKYNDPYKISPNSQKVNLPGIDVAGQGSDMWLSQDQLIHTYPSAQYIPQYERMVQAKLKEIVRLSQNAPINDYLKLVSQFFQYGTSSRMFEKTNESLFMNMANSLLEKKGLKPIQHGITDFATLRLQPDGFAKYFIDEVKRVNPGL